MGRLTTGSLRPVECHEFGAVGSIRSANLPALHHMTALEASPVELVSIARNIGAPSVCLFLNSPRSAVRFPVVTASHRLELGRALAGEGVTVKNLDFFLASPRVDAATYKEAFELGAELGGKRVVVLVDDDDRGRALDRFASLCGLAAEYGLGVGLEFMRFTPMCDSLAKAAAFVAEAGVTNAGVGVDILHLTRTGGTPGELVQIDPRLISHAQICDGSASAPKDEFHEAVAERMIPGSGEFPLAAFVAALPPGTDLDIEAPVTTLQGLGVSAHDRGRLAMEGTLRVIEAGEGCRDDGQGSR